jgi:hypothetical protein
MSDEANNNAGGNEGGNQGTDAFPKWMSSLPDAFKTNAVFAQYKDGMPYEKIADILGAESTMIRIPGEKATDEEKAAFYAKIGRPDKPEGYEIKLPADLPQDLTIDPEGIKAFQKFAHDNGFSKSQAETLFGWYAGLVKNGYEAEAQKKKDAEIKEAQELERTQKESVDALKAKWKDKFDGNTTKAIICFNKFCKDNEAAKALLDKKVDGVRLGDHPVLAEVFYEIGMATLDDTALFGKGGAGASSDKNDQVAEKMFPSMKKK